MYIANLISRIFEPTVALVIFTGIAAFRSGLSPVNLFWFFMALITLMLGPVMAVRLWLMKTKRVSDWHITNRKERIVPLVFLLASSMVFYLVVVQFHNRMVSTLFLLYIIWMIGFFLITLFWKISGHTSVITLTTCMIVLWYGWIWWPVLFLIPLVSWSRFKLKHHTLAQVIAGVVYSLIIIVLYFLYNS